MTKPIMQETAEVKQTPIPDRTTAHPGASPVDADQLTGEELEARIAPVSFGDITFTKHTSTSSP